MILDLIKNRKSVREYLEKDIPNDVLKQILTAGYLAPSWMNSQPWKFILVKDDETKSLLSSIALNQPHVKNANAVIAIIADKNAWDEENFSKVLSQRGIGEKGIEKIFSLPMLYPKANGKDKVLIRTVEQTVYAISYMMLTAKDLGVDSCVIGAINNETTVENKELQTKVNETLNLKEGEILIAMLTLGYNKNETPEVQDKSLSRKEFDEIVHFEKVGNKINF